MVSIINIKNTEEFFTQIQSFIFNVSDDFTPPLIERVDIDQFIDKIYQTAEIILAVDQKKLIGLSVFYCNDDITFVGYITLLAVSKSVRAKGVGKQLLKETIKTAKNNGMLTIKVKTEGKNEAALKLYKNAGFKIVGVDNQRFVADSSLILEKKLTS